MTLTQKDYQNIAEKIEKGVMTAKGSIEYEKDGEVLCIDYEWLKEGYFEKDTNAFIMTDDFFKAEAESFGKDCFTDNNFSGKELYKYVA